MTVINCGDACTLEPSAQANQNSKNSFFSNTWKTFQRFLQLMKNRRSVEKLNYMSDSELADMGLNRDDLYVINHSRLFTDPSIELQRRAFENTRGLKNR